MTLDMTFLDNGILSNDALACLWNSGDEDGRAATKSRRWTKNIERIVLQPPSVMRLRSVMMCSEWSRETKEREGGVATTADGITLSGFFWATQNTEIKDHVGLGRSKMQKKIIRYNGSVFGSTKDVFSW